MKQAVLVITALCTLANLHAAKIAGDDFSYSAGSIANGTDITSLNGGYGWNAGWSAANGGTLTNSVVQPGTAFSYSAAGISIPASQQNGALQFAATANTTQTALLSRTLSSAATTATNQTDVFVSFLVRFTNGTLNDVDSFYLWFGTAGTSTSRYDIGLLGNAAGDFQVRTSNDTIANSTGANNITANATTTYFIVGRLNKNASANFNEFSIWINPAADSLNTPNNTSTNATGDIASITTLGFGAASLESGDTFQLDMLQIGDTWEDVITPVPFGVDSTLGLVLLGGAAALRLRRKARQAR